VLRNAADAQTPPFLVDFRSGMRTACPAGPHGDGADACTAASGICLPPGRPWRRSWGVSQPQRSVPDCATDVCAGTLPVPPTLDASDKHDIIELRTQSQATAMHVELLAWRVIGYKLGPSGWLRARTELIPLRILRQFRYSLVAFHRIIAFRGNIHATPVSRSM
jgi:hypothetical protein